MNQAQNKYLIHSIYSELGLKGEYGLRLSIRIGNGRDKKILEKLLAEIKPTCEKLRLESNK